MNGRERSHQTDEHRQTCDGRKFGPWEYSLSHPPPHQTSPKLPPSSGGFTPIEQRFKRRELLQEALQDRFRRSRGVGEKEIEEEEESISRDSRPPVRLVRLLP